MNDHDNLERELTRWFQAEALEAAPAGRFEQAIEVTRDRRPRGALLAAIGSGWVETGGAAAARRLPWRTAAAVALLMLALLAGAIIASGQRRLFPAVVPALNGLLAYASGGDIYVGDASTGATRPIVTGPEIDSTPTFSPDGTHIAFLRGEWDSPDASIVVVRADGSDAVAVAGPEIANRMIVPVGFPGRGLGAFAWTPDSRSILIGHDIGPGPTGGYVTLFDASGVAEPRLLTPPLPRWPGGSHPQTSGEVAPMLRPPSGDRILSYPDTGPPAPATSTLVETDIDGSDVTVLIDPARTDLPFEIISGAVWSPDARWIAVTANDRCRLPYPYGCLGWQNQRIYLASADGSQVRPLTRGPADVNPGRHLIEQAALWSPDGSWILVNRTTAENLEISALDTQTFPIAGQILVVEVATGIERAITAPTSGVFGPPYGGPDTGIEWVPSSTSSWAPDGRSVLVFDGPGTRPTVIDVETGAAATLSWETDSHPSWQRDAAANLD